MQNEKDDIFALFETMYYQKVLVTTYHTLHINAFVFYAIGRLDNFFT